MTRAHLRFDTTAEATKFVATLNSDGTADKYVLTDSADNIRVDARSLLGVVYMMTEHNDSCYLINETHDGKYPSGIDKFRI